MMEYMLFPRLAAVHSRSGVDYTEKTGAAF